MKTANGLLLTMALSVLTPLAAHAHHGAALFDFKKRVTVEGTILKVAWQNPHVYLTIESRGPDGKPRQQDVQAASLSMIRGLGLTREMVTPGTHVQVNAAAQKSGADHLLWGQSITFDDGSTYLLETVARNTHIPAVPAATGLAGKWVPPPGAMQVFLQPLPLNEAASAASGALRDPRGPASFCDRAGPVGVQAIELGALAVLHTLEIEDKRVVMRIDADGHLVERVVHLDQTTHPADVAPSALGHSIGHWEGGTLVIDTVDFAPSLTSSRDLHAVERLTLAEDKRHLSYEATMDDPKVWTKPVALSTVWDYRPDVEPSGAKCDPQNARRYLEGTFLKDTAPGAPSR